MDHLPLGVLGGLQVGGDRNLARATTVNGTANESQLLLATLGIDIARPLRVIDAGAVLARKIRARQFQREVIERGFAIRDWVAHVDMGAANGGEAAENERLGEHFDGWIEIGCLRVLWCRES